VIRQIPARTTARRVTGTPLMLGGLAVAVWRGTLGVHLFRLWLGARVADPSAAEVYQIGWWIEAAYVVVALGASLVGWFVRRGLRADVVALLLLAMALRAPPQPFTIDVAERHW
jgi:hypothetical protein